MIEDVQPNAGLPVKPARKPRKPAVKKKKPTTGRKTLVAALVVVAIASVDLYLTVRYPGAPGACQILRDML